MSEQTFWNGEPTPARRVRGRVIDDHRFPRYWARDLVGTNRNAVEVTYNGETFYLDDDAGGGWAKVTTHHGSPRAPHRDLALDPESVTERSAS